MDHMIFADWQNQHGKFGETGEAALSSTHRERVIVNIIEYTITFPIMHPIDPHY
jgi:hypothetical protein